MTNLNLFTEDGTDEDENKIESELLIQRESTGNAQRMGRKDVVVVERPRRNYGYILASIAVSAVGYFAFVLTIAIGSGMYSFLDNFKYFFDWFLNNAVAYKIIIYALLAIKEGLAIITIFTQFFLRARGFLTIIGWALIIAYAIANIIFSFFIGFLNKFVPMLILVGAATVILFVTVVLIGCAEVCNLRSIIKEITDVKNYLRFGLFITSSLTIIATIPFFQSQYVSMAILIITYGLLWLLMVIILNDMFDTASSLHKRSNIIETSFYLLALSSNMLYAFQVAILTVGVTSLSNVQIQNVGTASKKNRPREKKKRGCEVEGKNEENIDVSSEVHEDPTQARAPNRTRFWIPLRSFLSRI